MIQSLIGRYKTIQREKYFNGIESFRQKYAFVGTGQHAITNLYPLLHHFGIDLKHIVSKKLDHAATLAKTFPNCTAANNIEAIINDESVKGVFVCTTPQQHFTITSQLLAAGKNVYVEKPPCYAGVDLNILIDKAGSKAVCHAGLQQRQSPGAGKLRKYLGKTSKYEASFLTGLYPEGNELYELYIHPIDLLIHLFGEAKIAYQNKQHAGKGMSIELYLEHANGIHGRISLSTAYSWTNCQETITLFTDKERVEFNFPFQVKKIKNPSSVMSVSLEKIRQSESSEIIFNGLNFSTALYNQGIFVQGFYKAVHNFIKQNEGLQKAENMLPSLQHTYHILDGIH